MKNRFLSVAFFGLLASTGCGGSVDLADFPNELESASCANAVKCGLFTSEAECKKYVSLEVAQIIATVNADKASYDADKAADCLDALRGRSCSTSSESQRETPSACDGTFKGKTAAGGACTDGSQCSSGSCNMPQSDMACAAGTCGLDEAALGASCAMADCQAGSYCNDAQVCAALLPAGAMCFANRDCAYGMTCFGEPGKCTATAATGASCATADCDKAGDICDTTTMLCKAKGREGDACPASFAGFAACINPLVCDQTTLKCAARPAIGAACFSACEAGAFCNQTSKKCEAEKADGGACAGDLQCVSNNCEKPSGAQMGTCKTPTVCM
jgi:hypothetical protein